MSDTEFILIGKYVVERMPGLTSVIKKADKPTIFEILLAVSELLCLDIYSIMGASKETPCIDGRVIFAIITITIHDPERLHESRKSKIIPDLAIIMNRTTDAIYHYIGLHNQLVKCNAGYRAKYKYVQEAIIKG